MASAEDDQRTDDAERGEHEPSQGSGKPEESRDGDEQEGADGASGNEEEPEGRAEIRELEEADEVPSDPSEWPGGKAKYQTFGGGEGQSEDPFGEGVTEKLGPGDVHHQPDGSVIVKGEKVDDPDEYKGEPIPGGPTDPNAPKLAGESDESEKSGSDESGSDESGSDESGSEKSGSQGSGTAR